MKIITFKGAQPFIHIPCRLLVDMEGRKEQMVKKCSVHRHSHTETTPNEAFSNTQVPCSVHYYQTPPSPQDKVH